MACAIPIPWQVNGATSWDEPDEYREMNQAIKQLAEATTKGGAETAVDPQALQNLAMARAKVGDGEGAGRGKRGRSGLSLTQMQDMI